MAQNLQWFLESLEGVEGSNSQYTAWCPCHDDIGTSRRGLSITETADKILMKCHSCGATLPDVQRALEGEDPYGLSDADFSPRVHKTRNGHRHEDDEEEVPSRLTGMAWWVEKTGIPEKTWEDLGCVEYQGGVAFTFEGMDVVKIRRPPKVFSWAGVGERPPLWPLPEDKVPEEVAITEGESDCGTLRHVGIHAFAITAGAGKSREGKKYLNDAHFSALVDRGAKKVILCGDMDASGAEMLAQMAGPASRAGLEVAVMRLDEVLDPFSGIKDLNGVWKECLGSKNGAFGELLHRAAQDLASAIPTLSLEEILTRAAAQMEWYIPGLISPSDKVLISGPQKSYKTWVALEVMRALVSGNSYRFLKRIEWPIEEPRKVMFIQEEHSAQGWAKRIRKLNLPKNAPVLFWHRQGFKFTDPEKVSALIDVLRREKVDMVIFDPLQRMMPGVKENDASETGIVWDEVMRIQEAVPGIVVLVVHHASKAERLTWESVRGSSRHAGEVDVGVFLEKHPIEDDTVRLAVDGRDIPRYMGTGDSFTVRVKISKDEDKEQFFDIDGTEMHAVVHNTGQLVGKKNRDAVFTAIRGGSHTRSQIMRSAGLSDSTVREHLHALMEDGMVEEVDNGKGIARSYVLSTEEDSNGSEGSEGS